VQLRRADVRLTLVSRVYCHLCSEMAEALQPLADEFGVEGPGWADLADALADWEARLLAEVAPA